MAPHEGEVPDESDFEYDPMEGYNFAMPTPPRLNDNGGALVSGGGKPGATPPLSDIDPYGAEGPPGGRNDRKQQVQDIWEKKTGKKPTSGELATLLDAVERTTMSPESIVDAVLEGGFAGSFGGGGSTGGTGGTGGVRNGYDPKSTTPINEAEANLVLNFVNPAWAGYYIRSDGAVIDGATATLAPDAGDYLRWDANKKIASDILSESGKYSATLALSGQQAGYAETLQGLRLKHDAAQAELDRAYRKADYDEVVHHNRALEENMRQQNEIGQKQFVIQVLMSLASNPFAIRAIGANPMLAQLFQSILGADIRTLLSGAGGGPPGGPPGGGRPARQIVG